MALSRAVFQGFLPVPGAFFGGNFVGNLLKNRHWKWLGF
jgi:hypothetical protein